MANFQISGLENVIKSFSDISSIPDDVKKDILKAMGNATSKAQAASAEAMGVKDTGAMIESLQVKSPKLTDDGGSVTITFKGTRTDENHKTPTRNAEIAFINEFGKDGQQARPFIKTANTKNEAKIAEAGQTVFNRWIDDKT